MAVNPKFNFPGFSKDGTFSNGFPPLKKAQTHFQMRKTDHMGGFMDTLPSTENHGKSRIITENHGKSRNFLGLPITELWEALVPYLFFFSPCLTKYNFCAPIYYTILP